jgi:CO/xanthine dehydrogenase Mo-binding subunit
MTAIGQPIEMSEARLRVTGELPFAGNVRIPGLLHGRILRSHVAHGRIVKLNAAAAERRRGVVAVLTGRDLTGDGIEPFYGPVYPDRPLVAIDRVRFAGEPVAAVIAEDLDVAEEALGLIEIEYAPLPTLLTAEEAIHPDAPAIHEGIRQRDYLTFPDLVLHPGVGKNVCNWFPLRRGDIESGFQQADEIFSATYRTPAQQHVPLEPHTTIAAIDGDDVDIWTASAAPFTVRAQVAETLRVPTSHVRVRTLNLGGAFGAKTYPRLEPLVVAMSWKAGGRPVKVALRPSEEFYTITRHASTVELKTGVRRDGTIVAREVRALWAAGAYADISPRLIKNGGYSSAGPYSIPNVKIDSYAIYTNTTPSGGFRGYGVPQVAWAYESQMDEIAAGLGIDPLELRLRNVVRDGDEFATGQVMEDMHLDEMLGGISTWLTAPGPLQRTIPSLPPKSSLVASPIVIISRGVARGRGIACIVKTTGTPSTSSAGLRLNDDGSLSVLTSTVEIGQGSRTSLRQIAADAVGVPVEWVGISYPDTIVTPWDQTTSSSRSTLMMGGAIRQAGAELRRQLIELASAELEVDPSDTEIEEGRVVVLGYPEGARTFGELIRRAGVGNLLATAVNRSEGSLDPETGQGVVTPHFYHAVAGAEVEVDLETGLLSVARLRSATWAGQVIHPVLAELQCEGNMAFGVGQALFEEIINDNGQIVNPTLADYMIPSILDLGADWSADVLEQGRDGRVHGLGESTAAAVPAAIGNALFDAVGIRIRELPLRPERVLQAVRAASNRRQELMLGSPEASNADDGIQSQSAR